MKDLIKFLVKLQDIDSLILQKRLFIDKVPKRISEVDEPLKQAKLELDQMKHGTDEMGKKKRDAEKKLEEINEKIKKMKSRITEIKTNKEYQAHLKEIETSEKDIGGFEEQILIIMEEMDNSLKRQKAQETKVLAETEKLNAFKKKLDEEVNQYENELSVLKEERRGLLSSIDLDVYDIYMKLLGTGNGIAVTRARQEICLGCNMNVPPQLFVEIRKNEEIIQCPQCRRILYYSEE